MEKLRRDETSANEVVWGLGMGTVAGDGGRSWVGGKVDREIWQR